MRSELTYSGECAELLVHGLPSAAEVYTEVSTVMCALLLWSESICPVRQDRSRGWSRDAKTEGFVTKLK